MRQATEVLQVRTGGPGLVEITEAVSAWTRRQAMETGLLTLFCRHTSASLLIQENADPDVQRDLQSYFATIAPEDSRRYRHDAEGPDDMPAHIRSALTQTQLSIPLIEGRLTLGTWQGIYLFEHRREGSARQVAMHLIGE
jgi:secondary thiamine-phosphate synthase enzyme